MYGCFFKLELPVFIGRSGRSAIVKLAPVSSAARCAPTATLSDRKRRCLEHLSAETRPWITNRSSRPFDYPFPPELADGRPKERSSRRQKYSIGLITDVIATDFETKYPNTFKVLANADIDAYFITAKLKKTNGRLRPYVQHPVLVTPLFTVRDFSYPSGHSSGSELQARILGKLFPTRIDALLTRARQVADGRVVAGVHYASDAEAGIALGDLLFTELENKPEFENDLTAALTKDQISLK
jgi:hypothetical protein